ncbi:MAG: hypothetical protein HDS62_02675 [Bacteroidales bacterium]|nr:hypothetical protein [Bacteroidales bacterium]
MKKINIFSALALTMVMASCDNFDLPNPPGQTNTDPAAYFETSDLALAPVSDAISIAAANEANQQITVANITTLQNFPEGYDLAFDLQVAKGAEFDNATTIATAIDGDAVTVNPDILNGAIRSAISKAPGAYDVNARLIAYAVKGDTRLRLGGENYNYLTEVLNVTTPDPEKFMEQSYYLVKVADGTPDWNGAFHMNNNGGADANVYDSPVFSVKIDSPAPDGCDIMIAPASAMAVQDASLLLGVNMGESGMDGKIGEGYGAGHISITGDVLVTVNVETEALTLSYAFDVLYPYSGSLKPENMMLLYTNDYITYSGVCAINNQWFLGATTDKKAEPLFRQSDEAEPEYGEDGYTMNGLLSTDPSASQIRTPLKGNHLYWVSANLPNLTYEMYGIENLAVIGNGNGWSHDTSVDLTPSKDFKTWTATDVNIDGEFKIAANKSWDVSFSGKSVSQDSGAVVYNVNKQDGGDNLNNDGSAPAGKYDVKLDFSSFPYVLTLTKK